MELTVRVMESLDVGVAISDLTILAGDITVGTNNNLTDDNLLTTSIIDGSSTDITISKAGYYPYTTSIDNVYAEDKEVVIVLVPIITDITDLNYQRPSPRFFYFSDPCSFNIDVYSASSFSGEVSWYFNNELQTLLNNVSKFTYQGKGIGQFQLKVASKTYINNPVTCTNDLAWLRQWANGDENTGNILIKSNISSGDLLGYLQEDVETNLAIVEYRPTIDFTFSSPSDILNDVVCYTQYENITISPDVTLTRINSESDQHLIKWEIIDPEGLPVILEQQEFPLNISDSALKISFQLDKLGTYSITATVTDLECNTQYSVNKEVETCMFSYVETTGECGEFTLYNKSSLYDIDYSINLVGSDMPELTGRLDNEENEMYGTAVTFKLPEIGIHIINLSWTDEDSEDKTMYLIVNNFCVLWDCLAGYINETLCNVESLCDPCPDSLRLNQMVLFNMAYSMKLHKEFSFNNFYSTLDQSKLDDFMTTNKLADKIKEFCARLGCKGLSDVKREPNVQFPLTKGVKVSTVEFNEFKTNTGTTDGSDCGCGG